MDDIFALSQHVTQTDNALGQLKKLYKRLDPREFEQTFKLLVKKLFQSKHGPYFKTSCDFLCKFLQHLNNLSEEAKQTKENTVVNRRHDSDSEDELVTSVSQHAGGGDSLSDEDELVAEGLRSTRQRNRPSIASKLCTVSGMITEHDKIVSACFDIADQYMHVVDDECRLNATFFVYRFLHHMKSVDEAFINALKSSLPRRIRDRKHMIRAQAVLASRMFQADNKTIQEAFKYHFYRDPEISVRKALIQIMDPKVFGFDFLVESTRDAQAKMRKLAYHRLGKFSPKELNTKQLQSVLHNGLNERERQASFAFKTHTLEPWLKTLYDGTDLHRLISLFDVVSNHEDMRRLLDFIHGRDLDTIENNATTTRLHQVVEAFREQWLSVDNKCLPLTSKLDDKVIIIWLNLIKFCKTNQKIINPIKIKTIRPQTGDPNESIEKILDSQEEGARVDEEIDLYDRLMPDLVNLVEFIRMFVQYADKAIRRKQRTASELEFIYHELMQFVSTYEVGDELERKSVQEIFGLILRENLLTDLFTDFITPVVTSLYKLIYYNSSNLMVDYISELIQNVRSHLEDLILSTQNPTQDTANAFSAPSALRSNKKIKLSRNQKRVSYAPDLDSQALEVRLANLRVNIEEMKDKLDEHIRKKDFDQAKAINMKIDEMKAELRLLHDRRCSIASDITHMSMIVESGPVKDSKLSSTMIAEASFEEQPAPQTQIDNRDGKMKVFKYHTKELIKCLQMYYGCLRSVKVRQIPLTMLNHLRHMTYECLDEWFTDDHRVRALMVLCTGISAFVDGDFAKDEDTRMLLLSAAHDSNIVIVTAALKGLVDTICQHDDLGISLEQLERLLDRHLREYGVYDPYSIKPDEMDFCTTLIHGTTKLFYAQKIASPKLFAHLILWWYHPNTHSKIKQFIGVFMPTFVNDISAKEGKDEESLKELFENTFVISLEYLHNYILGPGYDIMGKADMNNLVSFLCNLIPISAHKGVMDKVEDRIDELSSKKQTSEVADLLKYLKQSVRSIHVTE